MSIQRWAPFDPMALMGRHPNGAFVTHADHLAAVAAAEQERDKSDLNLDSVWAELHLHAVDKARTEGYWQGVKAAREAVVKLIEVRQTGGLQPALDAIDALRDAS